MSKCNYYLDIFYLNEFLLLFYINLINYNIDIFVRKMFYSAVLKKISISISIKFQNLNKYHQ